jgi:uncharacterized protein
MTDWITVFQQSWGGYKKVTCDLRYRRNAPSKAVHRMPQRRRPGDLCRYVYKLGAKNMTIIEQHKHDIAKICADLRVKRLDIVGSAARDDFRPEKSDIDVLVEFEGVDRLFDRYFDLKKRLEHQLGRQVDVIQESAVRNPFVRKSLDQDRVRIYGS